MVDKMKVACFSGHRNLLHDCTELQTNLEKAITELIERGVVFFGNGGAVGFDALAATAVLKLKEDYPHIRLVMVLPCPPEQQSLKWSAIRKNCTMKYLDRQTRYGFCRNNIRTAVCSNAIGTWLTAVRILSVICANTAAERSTRSIMPREKG